MQARARMRPSCAITSACGSKRGAFNRAACVPAGTAAPPPWLPRMPTQMVAGQGQSARAAYPAVPLLLSLSSFLALYPAKRLGLPVCLQFFMAPSLTTAKGAHKEGRGFSRYNFQRLGPPIATLELRYETATALLLRGVLQGSDPAHRAILQQFPGGGGDGVAAGPRARCSTGRCGVCLDPAVSRPIGWPGQLPAACWRVCSCASRRASACLPTAETARDEDSGADEDEEAACSSRAAGRKRARHAPAGQQPEQHGQRRQRRQQREEFIDLTKARCPWLAR